MHLYPVFRVKIPNIEDKNVQKAILKAEQHINENKLFSINSNHETEYASKIDGALVDIVGDEDYSRSTWFTKDEMPSS